MPRCVGEAMIPLDRVTPLNPIRPPPPFRPPKIPHYLAHARPEATVQLSVSTRGNYTPAETEEEAYRGAHTTHRRPCDQPAAARRCYYPQRVDCWNLLFLSLDDSHSKREAAALFFSIQLQSFKSSQIKSLFIEHFLGKKIQFKVLHKIKKNT